jgi:Tfp pilus assembly protein PilF
MAAGRKSEALRHLERAVHLDPLLQQAVELLSSLYRDEGESAKAAGLIAQYRREMGFDPAR